LLRSLPSRTDYLDLVPEDALAPGDLAGLAAWCASAARDGRVDLVEWYRELALALAGHFDIRVPVVGALLSRAGVADLERALVEASHSGRSLVLRHLWSMRERLLQLPSAWSRPPGEDPFAVPLDDEDLERQVDEVAGAVYAHADAGLRVVESVDRAILALWTGEATRAGLRVTVRELQEEGMALRGG
jgi:hypothetical protein